jgi:hypothetical protein
MLVSTHLLSPRRVISLAHAMGKGV